MFETFYRLKEKKTIITVVVLFFIVFGVFKYSSKQEENKSLSVLFHTLVPETMVKTFVIPSVAQAINEVPIKSQVRANLKEIHVKTGQEVKKDELLFTLDPKEVETDIQRNKVSLANLEQQILYQQKKKERSAALNKQGFSSNQVREDDEITYKKLSFQKDEILKTLQSLEITKDYYFIKAPFDGKLGIVDLSAGTLIQQNTDILTTIITTKVNSRLNIPLNPYQYDLLKDNLSKMEISYEGTQTSLKGTCTFQGLDNKVSSSDGMIYLRSDCSSTSQALLEGLVVRAKISLPFDTKAYKMPSQSIVFDLNKPFVWVLKADSTVEKRQITLSPYDEDDDYWVIDGLVEGEKIASSHVADLRENLKVSPKDGGAK